MYAKVGAGIMHSIKTPSINLKNIGHQIMNKNQWYFRWKMMVSLLCSLTVVPLSSAPVLAAFPHIIFPSDEGITLVKGRTYAIQWGSVQVDPVNILLCTEDMLDGLFCFRNIAVGVPNTGSYSWTVPNNLANDSNYVIGVGVSGVSIAFSDIPFTISDSSLDSWSVGAWGNCSARCGGGTKTRDVVCKDSLGNIITDSYCTGTKPSSTLSCNTDPCPRGMMWLPILLE